MPSMNLRTPSLLQLFYNFPGNLSDNSFSFSLLCSVTQKCPAFPARTLELVAISSLGGSSQTWDWTRLSCLSPCWIFAKARHTVLLLWLQPILGCIPFTEFSVFLCHHLLSCFDSTHTSIVMKNVGREILFQTWIPESVLFCSLT